jgi:hypothetical protein
METRRKRANCLLQAQQEVLDIIVVTGMSLISLQEERGKKSIEQQETETETGLTSSRAGTEHDTAS